MGYVQNSRSENKCTPPIYILTEHWWEVISADGKMHIHNLKHGAARVVGQASPWK